MGQLLDEEDMRTKKNETKNRMDGLQSCVKTQFEVKFYRRTASPEAENFEMSGLQCKFGDKSPEFEKKHHEKICEGQG